MSLLDRRLLKSNKVMDKLNGTHKHAEEQRKKANDIRDLIERVGERMAPDLVRLNENIKPVLEAMGVRGTMNESIVARLYLIALRGRHSEALQAIRFLMEIVDNKKIKGGKQFILNFISPAQEVSKDAITTDLTSDAWSIVPGEGRSDIAKEDKP